jgi:hypothetical protein
LHHADDYEQPPVLADTYTGLVDGDFGVGTLTLGGSKRHPELAGRGRHTVPNRVIVKVGTGWKVSFYSAFGSVHVIADIGGWFTDSTLGGTGSTFTGITSGRIYDTRAPGLMQVGPNSTISVPVAGLQGVPAMNSLTPPTARSERDGYEPDRGQLLDSVAGRSRKTAGI